MIYKLFEEIAPRYTERPGGYTRILKLPRSSDATEMVYLELSEREATLRTTRSSRAGTAASGLWLLKSLRVVLPNEGRAAPPPHPDHPTLIVMRHQKTRHKLSRDSAHRKALLANLCVEVIDHERIKTTEAKAKAVKPELEKLITLARKGDLHARRQAISILQHPDKGVIYKLFEEIAPRYTERPGGYTRILKLGPRSSDSTEMVYLELV